MPQNVAHSSDSGLATLLHYARPHWRTAVLAALGMILEAAIAASFTYLMKHMLDDVFVAKDANVTRLLPWVILLLFALRALAVYVGDLGAAKIARSIVRDLRERTFAHYLRLPTAFFAQAEQGPMLSRLTVEVEQLGSACTDGFKIILADGLMIVGLLSVMLITSVKLTLTVLIVGPLIGFIVGSVSKRFKHLNRGIQDSLGAVTTRAQAVISGEREVKIYGAQSQELAQFQAANAQNFRSQMKVTATNAISTSLVQFFAACALALVIFVAARGAVSGRGMTPGEFMSFITSMLLILPSLKRLTNVQNLIARGVSASNSIEALLSQPVEPDSGTQILSAAPASIEFRQLSVRYPGCENDALSDINLHVSAASTVALVGRSGGGKSTLANVLPRFVVPTQGAALIAGIDVQALVLADLREHIGWVGQQVVLNADTVLANVAYGAAGADEAKAWTALRQANAEQFVQALPGQLHAHIGYNGALLSGGQRQRLALARALYKRPAVLILDEATSALDNESERAVQDALKALRGSTTMLVIAHRLSTIENADQIIVLDQGRILQQGSHAQLLAQNGLYAQLHRVGFASD
jgi:ATP-binding cassette, subfamily B, bacterial MsbA